MTPQNKQLYTIRLYIGEQSVREITSLRRGNQSLDLQKCAPFLSGLTAAFGLPPGTEIRVEKEITGEVLE